MSHTDPTSELRDRLPGIDSSSRALDRLTSAHDASHYLLVPELVVTPKSASDVARLVRACGELGTPLTFRSGGTSLSGQAGSEHVLVDTRRHFRGITVLDDGARVRVQPGATVRQVNARLAAHGTRLGPDPASESACTLGGVIANNSSGMACGTEQNTYNTIDSAVLVLADGATVDTGAPDADLRLRTQSPDLFDGLLRLQRRVRESPASVADLQRQFALKNTMGYGLNAFLDHDTVADLLLHLVVGSEGTLAWVAEATFRTVPIRPHVATGLLVFDDLRAATETLPELVATGLATIELMDATSLRVCQRDPAADGALRGLDVDAHAALLVEFQEPGTDALAERTAAAQPVLAALPLATHPVLTDDSRRRASLWHLRKGLYAAVAGARPSGTTALLEDVAVPVSSLAQTCGSLTDLFDRHGYQDSVIFGHAKDGNIHFMLNERFDDDRLVERYLRFTDEMVDLVLGHGGTLKAEHGTGRIMAPFVRRQYGDELYGVMVELKQLCDPGGVLNPGVIINDDSAAHVSHLKTTPEVESEVDRCVECGFCEPVCPSKDLTLTPRKRIVARREQRRAELDGDTALRDELADQYEHDGIETCAADGMCQTACPVLIDTGSLVKRLRAEGNGRTSQRVWDAAARHWGTATRLGAVGLSLAQATPAPVVHGAASAARKIAGNERVPSWSPELPSGGQRRRRLRGAAGPLPRPQRPVAVFFPTCTGAMFGPGVPGDGSSAAFLSLCRRAGVEVLVPPDMDSLCCTTPWKSKGMSDGHTTMAAKVAASLLAATEGGRLPVVSDATSCTEGLAEALAAHPELVVVDAMTFVREQVLDGLDVAEKVSTAVVHPTCSSTRSGTTDALLELTRACAKEVVVPSSWGCCAFAGDRGLLHPELTDSATAAESAEVAERTFDAYVSCNRTCELGMTRATGRPYQHVLELLEAATRPAGAAQPEVRPRPPLATLH